MFSKLKIFCGKFQNNMKLNRQVINPSRIRFIMEMLTDI